MPNLPVESSPPAPEGKVAPAGTDRKPWHAPTLTQVALQVTGQASGTTTDKGGMTTVDVG